MIEDLPENDLATRVKALQSFQRDFKNRQLIGGASLKFSLYEPPGSYQWSGTITGATTVPGNYANFILFEYVAPNQDYPFSDLIVQMYIGSLGHLWNKKDDYYTPLYGGGSWYNMIIYRINPDLGDVKKNQWYVFVNTNDNATTIYLKYQVVTSDG